MVPPWVTVSRLLAGNREAELKPITFSSLLLFRDFLSFLFSPLSSDRFGLQWPNAWERHDGHNYLQQEFWWVERVVAVREVSRSSPGRGGHGEPSDYVSFRRAVERQRFHTINTHDTNPRTTQQYSLQITYVGTGSRSVPTRCHSLISSRMTYSAVFCISEKNVSSYKVHMTALY